MLTIAKLGAHSVSYYESTVDRDQAASVGADLADYYGEGGDQVPRVWAAGRNAFGVTESLGVTVGEPVTREAVESWIGEQCSPSTGEQLGRKVSADTAVLGYDLTFGAPKSVSMAWAMSEDEELREAIAAAHDAAIDSALDYLAEHAGWTRRHDADLTEQRGKQTKRLERLDGLAGVRYRHRTSRAGDMHLHSHVLVSNRQQTATGDWLSIDGTSLYHEARAGGSVYQATLRAALSERGLGFEATDLDNGFAELAGINEDDRQAWSQRHTEIEAWLDEHGISNRGAAAQNAAQKDTRQVKELGNSDDELREIWQADDRAIDVDAALAEERETGQERLPAESLPTPESVLTLVARTHSTFTRADVVEAACALLPTNVDLGGRSVFETVEAVANDAVDLSEELSLGGNEGRKPWEREGSVEFTTAEVVAEEAQALETAEKNVDGLGVDGSSIEPIDGSFSDQQAAAMRQLVESDQRASLLVAPAGAGKTAGLRQARFAWEVEGERRVVGYAPSGRAADQLSADNAVEESGTIATLLGRLDRSDGSGWDESTVVIVDEAGMASTPDLARMISHADETGAKLVLVGDPQQLGSVQARGGLLELMQRDLDAAELGEVFRQSNPDEAEASKALREGDLDGADWYRENKRVVGGSMAKMLDMAASGYAGDRRDGLDPMIVSPTREVVDALNRRIQSDLVVSGERDAQSGRGIAGGQWACDGDTILTGRNNYQLQDGTGSPVRNGQRWTVVSHDEDGSLIVERDTDNGPTRAVLPGDYVDEHVSLGYAVTVHAAQGATADACHVVMDTDRTDARAAYVGMTRGRTSNMAYVFERQVGDEAHQHRTDVADDGPVMRLDDEATAWEKFSTIVERESGDRAAHTVMRDRLDEQRADYKARTGKGWDEARNVKSGELMSEGIDPATELPQPSAAEGWDAARASRTEYYQEPDPFFHEDASHTFFDGVLDEMSKPEREGPGIIRQAAELGTAFIPDGGVTNAAMQLGDAASDAFYREDGIDRDDAEDRDSGMDL